MSSDIIILSDEDEDEQNTSQLQKLLTSSEIPNKKCDNPVNVDLNKMSLFNSLQLQPISKTNAVKVNCIKLRNNKHLNNVGKSIAISNDKKAATYKKVMKRNSKKVSVIVKPDNVETCIVLSDDEENASDVCIRNQIDVENLLSITKVENETFMPAVDIIREECISVNALGDVVFEGDDLNSTTVDSSNEAEGAEKDTEKTEDANNIKDNVGEDIETPRKKIKLSLCSDDNNDNIIILDDDDPVISNLSKNEENNDAQLNGTEACSSNSSINLPSMSECKEMLSRFIELCLEKIEDKHKEAMQNRVLEVKKMFDKLSNIKEKYIAEIKDFITEKTELISSDDSKVVFSFKDLFFHLKAIYSENDIDKETRRRIKKLEKTLAILRARIRRLEAVEVDFEDDDNSTYIQLQRYRERAVKVYNKMCQLQKRDPNESRVTYTKLDLYISKYEQINKSINKKYKNNQCFPSYFEFDQFVRKCIEKHKLEIPEIELQFEVRKCFEALGKKLKRRRQKELFEVHKDFIDEFESDPIAGDEEKIKIIKSNKLMADEKMQEIFHVYSVKQEKGEEPELSADSDDSVNKSDKSDSET